MEKENAKPKNESNRYSEQKKGVEDIHVEGENTWDRFKALCCSCCRTKKNVVADKDSEEPTQQSTGNEAAILGGPMEDSPGFSKSSEEVESEEKLPAHRTDRSHESDEVPQDTLFSGIKNSVEVAKEREAADKDREKHTEESPPPEDDENEEVQDKNDKVEKNGNRESANNQAKVLKSDKIATEFKEKETEAVSFKEENKSSTETKDGSISSTKSEVENKTEPESNEAGKSLTDVKMKKSNRWKSMFEKKTKKNSKENE